MDTLPAVSAHTTTPYSNLRPEDEKNESHISFYLSERQYKSLDEDIQEKVQCMAEATHLNTRERRSIIERLVDVDASFHSKQQQTLRKRPVAKESSADGVNNKTDSDMGGTSSREQGRTEPASQSKPRPGDWNSDLPGKHGLKYFLTQAQLRLFDADTYVQAEQIARDPSLPFPQKTELLNRLVELHKSINHAMPKNAAAPAPVQQPPPAAMMPPSYYAGQNPYAYPMPPMAPMHYAPNPYGPLPMAPAGYGMADYGMHRKSFFSGGHGEESITDIVCAPCTTCYSIVRMFIKMVMFAIVWSVSIFVCYTLWQYMNK